MLRTVHSVNFTLFTLTFGSFVSFSLMPSSNLKLKANEFTKLTIVSLVKLLRRKINAEKKLRPILFNRSFLSDKSMALLNVRLIKPIKSFDSKQLLDIIDLLLLTCVQVTTRNSRSALLVH